MTNLGKANCSVYWIRLPEHTNMFSQGYIGISTKDIRVRFSAHKAASKTGKAILHAAIRKYKEQIIIETILIGSVDYCLSIENSIRPVERIGWNTVSGGGKPPVFKGHSEESKKKIGLAATGRKHMVGKKFSDEHKANISTGVKTAVRKTPCRKPHSEETKAKMSAAHKVRTLENKSNQVRVIPPNTIKEI